MTDLENQFYAHIIAPIHHELERLGYQLSAADRDHRHRTVAERLIANGLDGVLLATTTSTRCCPAAARPRMPFVYFNRTADAVDADATDVDAGAGHSRGRRGDRRAWVTAGSAPSSDRSNTSTARAARARPAGGARTEHGLTIPTQLRPRGPFDFETGYDGRHELLARRTAPDGDRLRQRRGRPRRPERGTELGVWRSRKRCSMVGFDDLPAAAGRWSG